jgi:hypothetical protein
MAGITRANLLYNRPGCPGLLGISRSTFYENFILHSADDPLIPGTNVPRLRLLHLSATATAAFNDEVDALIEGLRRFRDESGEQRKPQPPKRRARTRRG